MAVSEMTKYNVKHLSGNAYAEVRDAILSGKFMPGVQLNERQLAEQFNVSRTPIRDALTRLAAEGLVAQIPHIGVFVRKLDIDEARALLELRRALEAAAAESAARRLKREEAEALVALAEEVDTSIEESDDTEQTRSLELGFHRKVSELSANTEIIRVLANVKVVYLTLFPQAIRPAIRDLKRTPAIRHAEIARGIAFGDAKTAHQLMWDHFEPTLTELRKNLTEEDK